MVNNDEITAKILDRLTKIEIVLAVQEQNLREHMRRTELAEKQLEDHARVYNAVELLFKGVVILGVIVTLSKHLGWI